MTAPARFAGNERTEVVTDVIIPPLGESITEATVGQWLKNPGDAVAADEPIVSLETDKVAVEVNAPVAGTLAEQLAKVGTPYRWGPRSRGLKRVPP
jgi:biotin carboxyl carrier protein